MLLTRALQSGDKGRIGGKVLVCAIIENAGLRVSGLQGIVYLNPPKPSFVGSL